VDVGRGGGRNCERRGRRREEAEKVMQYLSTLLLYIQLHVEGGRGGVISIKTRNICKRNKRCSRVLNDFMVSLVERGLVKMHKRGIYLVERRSVKELIKILKEHNGCCPPPKTGARKTAD
jgi:hypothetical protein